MPEEKCESVAPSFGSVQNSVLYVKDEFKDL